MMKSVTKSILSSMLAALMFIPIIASAQQSMFRIPMQYNGIQYTAPSSTTWNPLRDKIFEPTTQGMRRSASTSPSTTSDFLIGLMANTYATLGENRNQISYDPTTNTVAIIFRGNDRTPNSVGNSLYVRYSSDGGSNWSAQGANIASGISASPRYPEVCLYNPNKSTAVTDVKVSVLWPQVIPYAGIADTWGEVDAMKADYGSGNKSFKKLPTPPNWEIPLRIIPNYTTKTLYTFLNAVDQSNGTSSGEYYLFTSTDGGANWTPKDLNTPAWTSLLVESGSSASSLMTDVSPDGTHLVIGYMNLEVISSSIFYLSENHRIAYVESTDGGATWSSAPEYIRVADLPSLPAPLDVNPKLGWDLDVAYDKNNKLHFLVTVSTDFNPFSPLDEAPTGYINPIAVDSTYMCEVTQKSGDWVLNRIAKLHRPVVTRKSFSLAGSSGEQYQAFYTEPHFARTMDGYKLFAKWIDPDSTWKFPYLLVNAQNQITGYIADTIHNISVSGRDIRSNVYGGGWVNAEQMTHNTDVDTKYSKMGYFAGDNGKLQIMYTEWGPGETADDDPVNADCKVNYVKDVVLAGVQVSVNDKSHPMPTAYTLEQNYPNPFNPTTSISFTVPSNGKVKIKVFDLLGKEIATLANGYYEAGQHKVTFDASNIPSGIYVYRMESGSFTSTKKLTVLK